MLYRKIISAGQDKNLFKMKLCKLSIRNKTKLSVSEDCAK